MKTNFFGKIVSFIATIFGVRRKSSPTYNLLAGDRFLSHLAHELRTPLHTIIAQTEILLQEERTLPSEHPMRILQQAANYALALSNQCLQYSKLQSGRMELSPAPLDLISLLQKITGYVQHLSTKERPLITCFPNHPHEYVQADETALQQILCNLLNNAFQSSTTGRISFSATMKPIACEKLLVMFTIEDEGPGIPDALIHRIFDPFTQADSGKSGAGLGLAICHELVQLMNGSIHVENKAEKGTRFTVRLALPMSAAPEQNIQPAYSLLQGIRILVVEDNPVNLLMARKTLENWSCQVDEATTGMEALDRFNLYTYDLLLVDLHLPDISGKELLACIRKKDTTIPAIAYTAALEYEWNHSLKQAGFSAFISKPFRAADLHKKILQLTGNGKLQYQKYA
jgi:CheY-like chemotaxis protein/anti-sigma regulatory factor (Ser/Thr protein kinase)